MNTHPITVEQYRHFDGYPGLHDELINGRIVITPIPKPLHQQIRRNIERLLEAACQGTSYAANGNSNIEFSACNSAPSPDVFVVSEAAWEEAIEAGTYLSTPALLVVEVLSPSEDVSEKVEIYLTARIDAIWVVDPAKRLVTVFVGHEKRSYQASDAISLPYQLWGSVKVDDFFAGTLPESGR